MVESRDVISTERDISGVIAEQLTVGSKNRLRALLVVWMARLAAAHGLLLKSGAVLGDVAAPLGRVTRNKDDRTQEGSCEDGEELHFWLFVCILLGADVYCEYCFNLGLFVRRREV